MACRKKGNQICSGGRRTNIYSIIAEASVSSFAYNIDRIKPSVIVWCTSVVQIRRPPTAPTFTCAPCLRLLRPLGPWLSRCGDWCLGTCLCGPCVMLCAICVCCASVLGASLAARVVFNGKDISSPAPQISPRCRNAADRGPLLGEAHVRRPRCELRLSRRGGHPPVPTLGSTQSRNIWRKGLWHYQRTCTRSLEGLSSKHSCKTYAHTSGVFTCHEKGACG